MHNDTIGKILIAAGAALLTSDAFAETPGEYLETIDLNHLCIAYLENHQGFLVAKVKDPDGYFHTVTVRSRMGKDFGVITKITDDTVEMVELIPDAKGGWFERPLTLPVACPLIPPCTHSLSDGSRIVWLVSKKEKIPQTEQYQPVLLGLSIGDRRAWRWAGWMCRDIEPASSEEANELRKEYGDADLSRFTSLPCTQPRPKPDHPNFGSQLAPCG